MMDWRDIPLLPRVHVNLTVEWSWVERQIESYTRDFALDLLPTFQRAHVWTERQQTEYVQYMLRGGEVSRNLTFNCPGWNHGLEVVGPMVIVDGKQRLEAVRKFMRGELKAFGHRFDEFEGHLRGMIAFFNWRICDLEDPTDVLKLYLNINEGGTPHTDIELNKVRALLQNEMKEQHRLKGLATVTPEFGAKND